MSHPIAPRWAFSQADLEQALHAYARQGQGTPETRDQVARAVRAWLASPYGQCLRERPPQPGVR